MSHTLAMSIAKKELAKAVKREVQNGQHRIERLSMAERPVRHFGKPETAIFDQQRNMLGRILSGRSLEQQASDVIGRLYQNGLTPEQWNAADAAERMQALKKAQMLMSREMMPLPEKRNDSSPLSLDTSSKDSIAQMMGKDFVANCDAGSAYAKLYQALSRTEQAPTRLPSEIHISEQSAAMLAEAEKSYESAAQRAFEKSYNSFSGEGITDRNIPVEQYGAERKVEKWLSKLPRVETKQSIEKRLKECNPNYEKARRWKVNCQRCVPTYELRSRGYDVTAKPRRKGIDHLSFHPFDVWENAEIHTTKGDGVAEIEDFLRKNGEGTRVQIVVDWKYGQSGHTFAAEMKDGAVRFLDPQTGDADVRRHFANVKPGTVKFCRTDNLNMTKLILDCCKEVKRS